MLKLWSTPIVLGVCALGYTACGDDVTFTAIVNIDGGQGSAGGNTGTGGSGQSDAGNCRDQDTDGICDAVDSCPLDPDNDIDADGVCGDIDPCPTLNPDTCAPAVCGDGTKHNTEVCDGSEFGSATCASELGFGFAGSLSCNACAIDASACACPVGDEGCACTNGTTCNGGLVCVNNFCSADTCGNGSLERSDECEGTDFGAATCATELGAGHAGQLRCNACYIYTSGCGFCGDDILDIAAGEECDEGDTNNLDGCDSNCQLEPVGGVSCGNDALDGLEVCDPPDGTPATGAGCNATCNLKGDVTTLNAAIDAQSMTTDNTTIYLGVNGCNTGGPCGVAAIDIAACTAAPGTSACDPTFITGGSTSNCSCSSGTCNSGLTPAPDTVDGSASTATFGYMGTMTTDGTTIWVASQHVLREINIATGDVTTVTGTRGSCGAIDGDRSTGLLHDARGLTYWYGLVYLLDGCERVLRSYDPASGDLVTIAGTRDPDNGVTQSAPYTCPAPCSGACAGEPAAPVAGLGTAAIMVSPRYMTADNDGNLFIIDTNGEAILKYDTVSTQLDVVISGAVSATPPTAYTDSDAANTTIARPRGIISDGTSIYFGEQHHATIRQTVLSNVQTTTFVGVQGCDATGGNAARDGFGADTQGVYHTGIQDGTCNNPPSGPAIFHQPLGAMSFNFKYNSIFAVDGTRLRRIE